MMITPNICMYINIYAYTLHLSKYILYIDMILHDSDLPMHPRVLQAASPDLHLFHLFRHGHITGWIHVASGGHLVDGGVSYPRIRKRCSRTEQLTQLTSTKISDISSWPSDQMTSSCSTLPASSRSPANHLKSAPYFMNT